MLDFNLGSDMIRCMSFCLGVVRKFNGPWQEWWHLGNKEAIRVVQVRDDIVCTRGVAIEMRKSEVCFGSMYIS